MVSKRYTDSDGNECDLPTMCRREPGWAANRIAALLTERQRHAEEVAALEKRVADVQRVLRYSERERDVDREEMNVDATVEASKTPTGNPTPTEPDAPM